MGDINVGKREAAEAALWVVMHAAEGTLAQRVSASPGDDKHDTSTAEAAARSSKKKAKGSAPLPPSSLVAISDQKDPRRLALFLHSHCLMLLDAIDLQLFEGARTNEERRHVLRSLKSLMKLVASCLNSFVPKVCLLCAVRSFSGVLGFFFLLLWLPNPDRLLQC